jgi:hypothetical protein
MTDWKLTNEDGTPVNNVGTGNIAGYDPLLYRRRVRKMVKRTVKEAISNVAAKHEDKDVLPEAVATGLKAHQERKLDFCRPCGIAER